VTDLTKIKAILFDIDGTLVDSTKKLSQKKIKQLKKLHQLGIKIGVCTGRSYAEIKRYILPHFPKKSLHIVEDGAELVFRDGQVFHQVLMSDKQVKKIALKAEEFGADFAFSHHGVVYMSQNFLSNIQAKDKWQKSLGEAHQIDNWSSPLLGLFNLTDKMCDYLQSLDQKEFDIVESKNPHYRSSFVKLANRGVNKASAAKKWAKYHHLQLNQIMMIGDGDNDLGVLQVVGAGIAMGNAIDELKQVAGMVIGDVDQQGLEKFLQKFMRQYK